MGKKPSIAFTEDSVHIAQALAKIIRNGQPDLIVINRPDPKELQASKEPDRRYSLVIVLHGDWRFRTAQGEIALKPGQAMISPPGAWHQEMAGGERIKLKFVADLDSVYAQKTWHLDGATRAHKICWTYAPVSLQRAGYLLFQSLAALVDSHKGMTPSKLTYLALLHELHTHLTTPEHFTGAPTKSYESYRRIRSFLHQNFHQPISRDSVAAQIAIHPNHISRLFREHNPEHSFKSYLTRLRMERAARLISRRAFSVEETCLACGYTDTAHFRKSFKRYHGSPPGQFG